jgi:Ca2+/Na+ antiporter
MAACVVEVGGSWGAWQVLLASVMFNIALIAGMVCWFSPIRQQVKEVWSLLQEARA